MTSGIRLKVAYDGSGFAGFAPERWARALNRVLPEDVAVRDPEPCAPDYDPRFDALDKTYRYLFHHGAQRDPLLRARAWHLGRLLRAGRRLELDAMRACCARFTGRHDFRAFRAAADVRENTVRTLLRVELQPAFGGDPDLLALEVQGTAFMLNMVRILAGTLIEVGRGRMTPAQVDALLGEQGTRSHAGITAPAHGLTLLEVRLGRSRAPASPPGP